MLLTKDSKKITDIKDFLKTDTKIICVIKDKSLSYTMEILDRYSIDYISVYSKDLTIFERKKIKCCSNGKGQHMA